MDNIDTDKMEPAANDLLMLGEIESIAMEAEGEDFAESDTVGPGGAGQAPAMSSDELCTTVLMVGFNLIAGRRGEHWQLKPEEAIESGKALGAVLDKYFPDLANQGVEVAALMTITMVLTPRLMADKQIEAKKAASDKTANGEGADNGDTSRHAA